MRNKYGVDGVMIGRASIGYPWIFREVKHFLKTGTLMPEPGLKERIETCRQHFLASVKWKGEKTGIFEMRRHYAPYFKSLPGFKEYRIRLVQASTAEEVTQILAEIEHQYQEVFV